MQLSDLPKMPRNGREVLQNCSFPTSISVCRSPPVHSRFVPVLTQFVAEGWGCFVPECHSCLNPILIDHRTFLPQRTVPETPVSEPSLSQHTRLRSDTPDYINKTSICTYFSCTPLSQLYDFPKCKMVTTTSAKSKDHLSVLVPS